MSSSPTAERWTFLVMFAVMLLIAGSAGLALGADASVNNGDRHLFGQNLDVSDQSVNVSVRATHWQGQQLQVHAGTDTAGDVYQLRKHADGSLGDLITEFVMDENGSATVDSSGMDPDTYVIVDENKDPHAPEQGDLRPVDDLEDAWWELAVQELNVTSAEHTFGEPIGVTITSNRASYTVGMSSPLFNATELNTMLESEVDSTEINDDVVAVPGTIETTVDLDFEGLAPQEYPFRFEVIDTGAAEEETIVVEEPEETAAFDSEVIRGTRGDIETIGLNLGDIEQVEVSIRSDDGDYEADIEVYDIPDDGDVEIEMNTYLAGIAEDASDAFEASGASLEVERLSDGLAGGLRATDYDLSVAINGQETDIATLALSSQEFGELTARVADTSDLADTPEAIRAASTERDLIAEEDTLVLHFPVTGMDGLFMPGYNLTPDSPDATANGVFINIEDAENQHQIDLSQGQTVADPDGGVFFVIDADRENTGFQPGNEYRATFSIDERNDFVDEQLSSTVNFTVEERLATFREHEEGLVALEPVDDPVLDGYVTLAGESTVSPGTELVIILRSDDPDHIMNITTPVSADGSWSETFEIPSDVESFTVHVRDGPSVISEHEIAEVLEEDDGEEEETQEPEDDQLLPIHPLFVGIGGAVVGGWILLRYRDILFTYYRRFRPRRGDEEEVKP